MRKLLKHLKLYKKECILAPLFKMIEATFELLVPIVISYIIDTGIPEKNVSAIIWAVLILFGFALIGYICALTAQYFSAKAAIGFSKEVKHTLFKHVESLSFADLDKIGINSLITNMTSDINQAQTGVNMFLRLFLRSPFVVLGAIIMAFIVDSKTALIFAISIPFLAVFIFFITYISIPLLKKVQHRLEILLKITRDNLNGVRVIRAFNLSKSEINDFEKANDNLTSSLKFTGRINALLNPITYVIINLSIVAIFYFGGIEVNIGNMTNGEVVAQYNYMSQILVELIKLANFTITLNKAIACMRRIQNVLELENTQKFPETSSLNEETDVAVMMENVALCYPNNIKNSIENININIKKGETVGIIGGTGSGKTSLVNLLPGFYDNTMGTIELFGNDINNFSKKDLRKLVGTNLQEATLFKGTIRDNLVMGKEISDDKILSALEVAQGLDVINKRPEKLDTLVLQGGTNFSGGEKQRLCIARTLLTDPKILILDDSSSALDYLTDKKLRKAIKNYNKEITLFIVASRIASISDSNKIIVLDEGKIVGMDTHENLLKTCEVYKQIYYSQNEREGLV